METVKSFIFCFIMAVLLFPLFQNSASAAEKKVRFVVDGISWISTATEAEAIPRRLKGVQNSEVDMVQSSVTVIFDDEIISIEDIKKTLSKEGFPAVGEPLVMK